MGWLSDLFRPRVQTGPTAVYSKAVFYPVGAENSVYHPAPPVIPAMLPPVYLIGASQWSGNAPRTWSPNRVNSNQAAYVAGVGGPLAGQIIHQPLNVQETTNGSQ